MDLYARVNILDGKSVRLPRGNIEGAIPLDNDPIARAKNWIAQGVDYLHVVDLDAAAHRDYRNRPLIDSLMSAASVPVQVAGGVRSPAEVVRLLDAGAWRVVMGTAAIEDQLMVYDLCRDHPDTIVVALDVRPNEEIATRGWRQNSGRFLEEVLLDMSSAGAAAFLIAEAGRDALLEPPNLSILEDALAIIDEPVIAAGGVRNLDDLRSVMGVETDGRRVAGMVVGREVTHGRFTIEQAKAAIAEGPPELPAQPEPEDEPTPIEREIIDRYSRIADECEKAVAHARTAAQRHSEGKDRRAAAHGLAIHGRLAAASELLETIAKQYSEDQAG